MEIESGTMNSMTNPAIPLTASLSAPQTASTGTVPLTASTGNVNASSNKRNGVKAEKVYDPNRDAKSFNLRTLNTNANFKAEGERFIKYYFTNLVLVNDKLKKLYTIKSMLTLSRTEVMGEDAIFAQLGQFSGVPSYNVDNIYYQPTLGGGVTIYLRGSFPNHNFIMTFNLVKIRKNFRVLNQMIEVIACPTASASQ